MKSRHLYRMCLYLMLLSGCTGGGPQIVPIEGTVTHNGQPVPNVRIYFVPTDGRPSWAISDQNGHFALDYDDQYDGAKVGSHSVWIIDESSNVDPTVAMSGGPRPKRSPAIKEIADKYSREKSTLKVEVTKADRNYQLKLD
jgi:hypothetical protein